MKPKNTKKSHRNILSDSVRDYKIESNSISLLIDGMANSGGFESKNLWNGINIIRTMTKDKNCTKFLSFVGSIISTGARGIIKDMLKHKMFDCVITTCGALDHDIARTSTKYYSGDFRMDDNLLYKKNIHRLGNVLVPQNNYGPVIEKKVQDCLNDLYKKGFQSVSTFEITKNIGSTLDETSFLYWAYKNDIPVIVPGIVDGAVGSQIWFFYQKHKNFNMNILLDETRLSDLVYDANKTGAFIIGGGISKHHTIWWNQFRGGLDYAVSITTASEWDGSLSGALVAEAISWGKVKGKAKQTTIHGEATTLLPFIYAALIK
ncbi:MAG TPA: deoxyhypusine synthase [Nitrososphaeraceae archaeon]|nr:deoxyhypusine synthase [Nitrososphaeraceae archaeon]